MDSFLRYFYQDIGRVFRALLDVFSSFFNFLNYLLNFPMRMDIIDAYEPTTPKENERVAVYITYGSLSNGNIVKYLRKNHNIDKKVAKEAAAGLATTFDDKRVPFCLGQGLPLSQARELLEDVYKNLLKGEAEYRWE